MGVQLGCSAREPAVVPVFADVTESTSESTEGEFLATRKYLKP